MRCSRLPALALLVIWPVALGAQSSATVRGQVVDAASGAGIPAARVTLGAVSALTDADGRFEFANVAYGLSVVVAAAVGYRPARLTLDVLPGLAVERTLRLAALPPDLPTIAVQGSAGEETLLDHATLVRRGADMATAIDGWQGVVVRRSGSNGPASPQVRGSAPEEVIVLLDGFAINDPLTGRADLSRVATRDVASVQVRAGAQSAGGAGTAIGGVIDIRSLPGSGAQASGWLGSHGSGGGTLSGAIGEFRLFAQGERLADNYPYSVPPNRGGGEAERVNAGGTIGTFSIRRSGKLGIQGRASFSERGLPGAIGNETPHATASDWSAFLGLTVDGRSTWSGSLQYLGSDVADPDPPLAAPYAVHSRGVSGTLDWTLHGGLALLGWGGTGELGAAARHDRYEGDVVTADAQFSRGSIRASGSLNPSEESPWTLRPSARLDLWTGSSGPLGSARLDVLWRRGSTAFHGSAGSAVSAPALADLFFREGVGVVLNPGLRPERVRWEVEVGATQQWELLGRPATASVRGYYGLVDDMILWSPGVGFIWSPRNYDVIRRGVEGSLSIRPAATVTVEAQGAWTPITYDVPGGAQVQYRPRASWGAAATWTGGKWGADARWRWVGERYPNPGGVNPRPAFGLMDVGAERSIGAAVVRADIRDLFDTRAEFLAGYPTPGRTAILSITLEWQ
ncbi:MAG TPA: TonB-dependent receptor [Gemmatimonadales bacterium]|nr:TonB-dependent receptor [Gemmatimonadales bacterium]